MKNQSGRSMVEMLGVLAIIGVLSVGGISGYRTAMSKNQANRFINQLQIDLVNMEAEYQMRGKVEQDISMPDDLCFYGDYGCYGNDGIGISYMDIPPAAFADAINTILPCDALTKLVEEQTSATVGYCVFGSNGAGFQIHWPQ